MKKNLDLHLTNAADARKAYSNHRILTSNENGKYVLSFDFAENINLPQLIEEPAIFYF